MKAPDVGAIIEYMSRGNELEGWTYGARFQVTNVIIDNSNDAGQLTVIMLSTPSKIFLKNALHIYPPNHSGFRILVSGEEMAYVWNEAYREREERNSVPYGTRRIKVKKQACSSVG
jgi:hypothetical protein